jgi:hypothetical protein
MNRTSNKRLLICLTPVGLFLVLNIIVVGVGEWNYHKLKSGEELQCNAAFSDGGTEISSRFGYDLMNMHRFHVENDEIVGFLKGPRIKYAGWVLWPSHEDTFVETNKNSQPVN